MTNTEGPSGADIMSELLGITSDEIAEERRKAEAKLEALKPVSAGKMVAPINPHASQYIF